MTSRLTAHMIARFCKENLSDAELDFVTRVASRRPDLISIASTRGPGGFATEAEVARWWLELCQQANIGGDA